MSHVYQGEKFERATSRDSLQKRRQINKAYASVDFDDWLIERLAPRPGEDVLDVGCGTGAQTLPIARRVAPGGSVSAVDISADSVATLKSQCAPGDRVEAVVGDMADLQRLIDEVFAIKRYDLAQSTYALYYAQERARVLAVMQAALKPGGRLAVFTPQGPHGLVQLAARHSQVPQPVFDSLAFARDVLEPWFRSHCGRVETHDFRNLMSIPSVDEVIAFYRATTYYDAAAEPAIRREVEAQIARTGAFRYEKNGFLIIGRDARAR